MHGTGTAVERFQYGYDRDSNPLYKDNKVSSGNSELYHANSSTGGDDNSAYDKLNRLTAFRRGALSSSGNNGAGLDTVNSASRTQSWDLDALGNMDSVSTDGTPESRTHNDGNQITAIGGDTPDYDDNGNTTETADGGTYTYDAWNRMASATPVFTAPTTTHTVIYAYDALGRRIESAELETVDNIDYEIPLGTIVITSHHHDLFYSDQWQVLQDLQASSMETQSYGGVGETLYLTSDTTDNYTDLDQYVWGFGYVDKMVLRDRTANGVVTLDSDFSSDGLTTTDFSSGADAAKAVALQPDGKIIAAGSSDGYLAIGRYTAAGSLDSSFGSSGKVRTKLGFDVAGALAVAVNESDGAILVGGFATSSGNTNFLLARFNADGTLDTSFGSSGVATIDFFSSTDRIHGLLIQPDGKIVVAGEAEDTGTQLMAIARYNADGSLDTSFDSDGKLTMTVGSAGSAFNAVALQPDGKILAAGYATLGSDGADATVVRLNADGSVDSGFGSSGHAGKDTANGYPDIANCVAIAPGGRILLGCSSDGNMNVVAFDSDGTLDTSFGFSGQTSGPGGPTGATAIAVDGSGRITIVGSAYASYPSVDYDLYVERRLPDGTLDGGFGASGTIQTDVSGSHDNDLAYAVALSPIGEVIVVGGSDDDFVVTRYAPGGTATQRLYALQDANYNVTGLVSANGTPVEHFVYDPYGDCIYVLDGSYYGGSDAYDWLYRFQGGRLETATGKYIFRHRDYDPETMRWMEEDPAGYVDGANVYQYLLSSPTGYADPFGLNGEPPVAAAGSPKDSRVAGPPAPGTPDYTQLGGTPESKDSNPRDLTPEEQRLLVLIWQAMAENERAQGPQICPDSRTPEQRRFDDWKDEDRRNKEIGAARGVRASQILLENNMDYGAAFLAALSSPW